MPYFPGAPEFSTPGSGAPVTSGPGSYFGGNWVPGVTTGGTPGVVPSGAPSVVTTPAPTPTPQTFMGFTPPFAMQEDSSSGRRGFVDANGKPVPDGVVQAWNTAEDARKGVDNLKEAQAAGQVVSPEDMKLALDQYRDAIGQARAQYTAILGHEPDPSPSEVLSMPTGSTVRMSQVAQVSPAQRLQAAMQGQTNVGATGLDTGQADQSRALALQNARDLQATAAGAGAGQQAAAARLKLALSRSSQLASGMAAQARGSERRGLRREAIIQDGQRKLEGATALEAQAAQERQAAQGQLGQQLQATRSTDVDVAAKKAALDQERKTLQAQIDAAKAANDQGAINALTSKMADLDQRTRELNAQATNQAQARKEEQSFTGQQVDINRGLEVSRLTEEQRVANERLKLDASKAAQDAGQGLLTENARQEQLAFAREQLRVAQSQADRQFWGNMISSLISGVATVGAAAAMPATSDRRAKENIRPVKDADLSELAQAVRKSLATWNYKQESDGPSGERAGPMAQDLEKTRLGRAVTSERDDGTKQVDYAQLATLLAAATVKHRKREAV